MKIRFSGRVYIVRCPESVQDVDGSGVGVSEREVYRSKLIVSGLKVQHRATTGYRIFKLTNYV